MRVELSGSKVRASGVNQGSKLELWSQGFGILVGSLCLKQPQTAALQHDALDAASSVDPNQGCEVSGVGSILKVYGRVATFSILSESHHVFAMDFADRS